MSDIKDNPISAEYKGQNSSQDMLGLQKGEGERIGMIVRKAEKLTTALYMVSDIIGDREPIKWKMRETSVELLSDITLSGTASQSERLAFLRNVVKRIEKIVSFIDIAWVTRMVSEMNGSLLKREYLHLRDLVEKEITIVLGGNGARELPLPPMYAPASKQEIRSMAERMLTPDNTQDEEQRGAVRVTDRDTTFRGGTIKDISSHTQFRERESVSKKETSANSGASVERTTSMVSDRMIAPRETVATEKKQVVRSVSGESRVAKDDRRKIILALLKQKPALTVKDIGRSISGFSEKTIQRELVAMLDEGILTKQGEKRWTTYSLNTSYQGQQ